MFEMITRSDLGRRPRFSPWLRSPGGGPLHGRQKETLSLAGMKQRGPQRPTPPLAPPEFERLPSPALQPISAPTTWGTRQRIAEHLSKLDQESLDHLLDKVEPPTVSTAAIASATEPSFASTTASFAALTPHRHRSPRHHRPRHHPRHRPRQPHR